MPRPRATRFAVLPFLLLTIGASAQEPPRARARELGITVGVLAPGPLNAITDVAGVAVGHRTIVRGDDVRTGVTAVLPHTRNLFREKVPGAVFIGNAFGKLAGSTQVNELGEIETPIVLTSTLSVPRAMDGVLDHVLALPGNEDVRSVNALVAETNDGQLNDIRGRHVKPSDVVEAIRGAKAGAVQEGAVGAGTGTIAFGFKGGIGTSSRKLPAELGGYTVGVLVQTNYGGLLTINGAPVGRELGRYYLKEQLEPGAGTRPKNARQSPLRRPDETESDSPSDTAAGSVIVVVATDAPLDARNLHRLAARTMLGLARTGSSGGNGSGDYAIAFSTVMGGVARSPAALLTNDAMSPLFLAAIEATEEAVYNSLFAATTTTGRGLTVEALPIARTLEILKSHAALR